MNKLTALIEAAKAATPGPWWKEAPLVKALEPYITHYSSAHYADAKFIATANPATILELCALLEKAEAALKVVGDHLVPDYGPGHFAVQRLDKFAIDDALTAIKQWKEQT